MDLHLTDDMRERLTARSTRAMWGFMAVGVVLLFPSMGTSVVLIGFALLQRWMAGWLISNGRLVPASLSGKPRHAGENWTQESEFMKPMLGRGGARAFNGGLLFIARIIPAVLVACEFEIDGRSKKISKYMFSNERVDAGDGCEAMILVNPKFPRAHSWLVSHVPECDRGIIPPAWNEIADAGEGAREEASEANVTTGAAPGSERIARIGPGDTRADGERRDAA